MGQVAPDLLEPLFLLLVVVSSADVVAYDVFVCVCPLIASAEHCPGLILGHVGFTSRCMQRLSSLNMTSYMNRLRDVKHDE